jgi:hypothetical protein
MRVIFYGFAAGMVAHHFRSFTMGCGLWIFALCLDHALFLVRSEIKLCRQLLERIAKK